MTNVINPRAAGIDISSKDHYVCIPHSNPKENGEVKVFGSYTKDLHAISNWLIENEISTIAMESTGIYWIELFTILKEKGFEVLLVNAHHIKNVPGRKSDVMDAQWIQKLHSYGLLRGSYQPNNQLRTLRTLTRRRGEIVKDMTRATNRLIKSLEQMNIKTRQVITDIHGKTGTSVIKAILAGERDATEFLKYKDRRIKASNADFVNALEGNWKEEQLYCLELAQVTYEFLANQLEKLDCKIEEVLKLIQETIKSEIEDVELLKYKPKNAPRFNARKYFKNILGTDVTNIPGIKENGALSIISETGYDLEQSFPTEKQFLSWLNLVPNNKISGGKILSKKMKKKKNKAGQAFRESASTLWRSKTPLGIHLRTKKAKRGSGPAIVSTARKLASIYYQMVVKKEEFNIDKMKNDSEKSLLNKMLYYERKALKARELYEKRVA